ncbi:MAG: class I poly(R)-hydroxyalkanoic acid synthase [Bdellovibrionales bacterium]
MSEHIAAIAARSQKVLNTFLDRNRLNMESLNTKNQMQLQNAFADFMKHLSNDPNRFVDANINFWQDYVQLLQNTLDRAKGEEVEPVITPEKGDKRFKDEEWDENWVFDYFKESYLLGSRWAQSLVAEVQDLDPQIHHKVEFYTKQIVDALSPSNFWMMNPEVLRATIESKGENLVKGLEHMLADIEKGHGQLRITMSDNSAFEFGKNIATTPGKVVFQNRMFQLIQYSPLTEQVFKRPILFVPPWINKYYILDLKESNSMIRHLVDQGHTVFCMSWVNPDETYADVGFEDYMIEGPVEAARQVAKITGQDKINCAAYCIGGTLLATTMAWLEAAGDKKPEGVPEIASATFFATLIDFSQPGDLGVFIDEQQIEMLEDLMEQKGYLPGSSLAMTFSMLRANDLIWSFVVNNYLMGKEPFPFDLLTWNSDSTNMSKAMQSYYLRNMYLENNLIQPNKLSMRDVPIDLRKVKAPVFCVSTIEDHISLWRANYIATQTYSGPITYCLGGSGHIAGIINPPDKEKYCYWDNPEYPASPDEWFKKATQHKGSWWPKWTKWLEDLNNEKVAARDPANGNVIEDAPGSYVQVKGA